MPKPPDELPPDELTVVEITAEATHDLRRRVLRDGTPSADVHFAGDDEPGVIHLGASHGGTLVGVSTWIPKPFPADDPSLSSQQAMQLRGMATDSAWQGRGVGAAMLRHGVASAHASGAGLVWARARDTALSFYVRHGFEVVGDGFIDDTTQLAHHLVVRRADGDHS